ncbi:MAG TPA: helix-turn-helix transcriptional regulator [Ilumatobacteraceae bacterium]|nr:helix-turn-helix transcriptional regulator [Ilumatobacteraceae bacterium]
MTELRLVAGTPDPAADQPRLRVVIGEVLRNERLEQRRSLAQVAAAAAISLPYLSEVERGRKEVSSDVLSAITGALGIELVEVLERSADRLRVPTSTRVQGKVRVTLRAA